MWHFARSWQLLLFHMLPNAALATRGVAGRPMMGFNTWNKFGCSVNATILTTTADLMVSTGLRDAGYEYVNSDDCWMVSCRNPALVNKVCDKAVDCCDNYTGPQIPNPIKFPQGIPPVVDYIHSKGLKAGLYTSASPWTCAGFAASCEFEGIDAKQWSEWKIDYMKEDACGSCRTGGKIDDYKAMQSAIDVTGSKLILTIEGQPPFPAVADGLHGNARRVGHDISPEWLSMTSLVDIGSGLWSFAHNDTGNGGWWNDLDMIEIGNGAFVAEESSQALAMAQTHMTYWCIMKAVMLLGNDFTKMSKETLSVISNRDAISVNQDALGIAGRRVASVPPTNLTLVDSGDDALAVVAPCVARRQTQRWTYTEKKVKPMPTMLAIAPCNASDPRQHWNYSVDADLLHVWTPLQSLATGQCVDYSIHGDPLETTQCSPHTASQAYTLRSVTGEMAAGTNCLDVYNFAGPDVENGGCKQPNGPSSMTNQQWKALPGGMLQTNSSHYPPTQPMCLTLSKGVAGGTLSSTDALGRKWLLKSPSWSEANVVMEGSPRAQQSSPQDLAWQILPDPHSLGNVTISGHSRYSWEPSTLGFENGFGASGPLPHTRYLTSGRSSWVYDVAVGSKVGAPIHLAPGTALTDDDAIGNVKDGTASDFCIELSHAGNLEAWHAPLSNGRHAIAFINRSPASNQKMSLPLAEALGSSLSTASYKVKDIWGGSVLPTTVSATLEATVAQPHGSNFYILTPQS